MVFLFFVLCSLRMVGCYFEERKVTKRFTLVFGLSGGCAIF
jgi:hypothetical protein